MFGLLNFQYMQIKFRYGKYNFKKQIILGHCEFFPRIRGKIEETRGKKRFIILFIFSENAFVINKILNRFSFVIFDTLTKSFENSKFDTMVYENRFFTSARGLEVYSKLICMSVKMQKR